MSRHDTNLTHKHELPPLRKMPTKQNTLLLIHVFKTNLSKEKKKTSSQSTLIFCSRPRALDQKKQKKVSLHAQSICNETNSLYYFLVSSKLYYFKILLKQTNKQANKKKSASKFRWPSKYNQRVPKFSTKKEKEKKPNLWA